MCFEESLGDTSDNYEYRASRVEGLSRDQSELKPEDEYNETTHCLNLV